MKNFIETLLKLVGLATIALLFIAACLTLIFEGIKIVLAIIIKPLVVVLMVVCAFYLLRYMWRRRKDKRNAQN